MEVSEKAAAILELRHQSERAPTRKPNDRQKYSRQAWPLRVKIDAKLAAIRDEKALSDAE